ncbi:MAG: phosphoesterase family protein [Acidimicrobiales bacterium]|nr:phosphoesterase family protein [Acidimicrobiales bacterium]
MGGRHLVASVAAATAAVLVATLPGAARAAATPKIRHVFTIVLENEDFARTFGTGQVESPYLSRTLVQQGAFVPNYYGTGHSSLDNYIAMTSGQGPNPKTQGDCHDPSTLGGDGSLRFDGDGQAIGTLGCTYPAAVQSIGTQLSAAGFGWKGYLQDMDAQPGTQRVTCRGPFTENLIESPVPAGNPKSPDDYKDKHNPFVYYHSVFDDLAYCDAHDVPFTGFANDLASVATTPNFSFIVPNQCDDGHDMPTCTDGSAGGPSRYDAFLQKYVPMIQASAAYRQDGLILIVFDEGVTGLSCCNEKTSPNVGSGTNSGYPVPGPAGAGGGQTGAVLLSPFITPGTVSTVSYNHYSYLRSVEDLFGLAHLGYAAQDGLVSFGADVFNR